MHTYSLSGVETAHNKHMEKAEGMNYLPWQTTIPP